MNADSTSITPEQRVIVVGLGCLDRRDDGVGAVVAGHVRDIVTRSANHWLEVVVTEEPISLPDRLLGKDVAVIIDAVRSDGPAGTVTVRELGGVVPDLAAAPEAGLAGTHGFGLATAIELARALDRLPPRVVAVGVEGSDFGHGRSLTAPVLGAVPRAVDAVLQILDLRALAADGDVLSR